MITLKVIVFPQLHKHSMKTELADVAKENTEISPKPALIRTKFPRAGKDRTEYNRFFLY